MNPYGWSLRVLQISGNAESASPRFRAKCARPLSNVKAGSGNENSEVLIRSEVVGVAKVASN